MRTVDLIVILLLLLILALTIHIHYFVYESPSDKNPYWGHTSTSTQKSRFVISRQAVLQNPERVNKLLDEHNIANLRIITQDEFQEQFEKSSILLNKAKDYLYWTQANLSQRQHFKTIL